MSLSTAAEPQMMRKWKVQCRVSSDVYAVALFFLSSFLFLIRPQAATLFLFVFTSFTINQEEEARSHVHLVSHSIISSLLSPPLYLVFIVLLTTFRAALVYAACVCALEQHKHCDTLLITAMLIELQSSLSQQAQGHADGRPAYFPE